MTRPSPSPGESDRLDEILSEAADRSARNRQTRRRLPGGGTLFIDGRTPFLAVYRAPDEGEDPGGAHFAKALRSYLLVPPGGGRTARRICLDMGHAFVADLGVALMVELWIAPEEAGSDGEPPVVTVHATEADGATADAFCGALSGVRVVPKGEASPGADRAQVLRRNVPSPGAPHRCPLLPDHALQEGIHWIGIEIPGTFRRDGRLFPERMFLLLRRFSHALERAIYTWSVPRMAVPIEGGRQALGRQNLGRTARAIDGRLAAVASAFDLILGASPVNSAELWDEFVRSGEEAPPRFEYRPLHFDPEALKRSLFQVPLERIEDPLVAELIREKQEELDLRITMLRSRGRDHFFYGSLQLFGRPDAQLVELADQLLAVDVDAEETESADRVDAIAFAGQARDEIETYRRVHTDFPGTVELRDDITSGLLVSAGTLCIRPTLSVEVGRVDALIQHEVGTHVVTYFNGTQQPLRLMASGLAYYGALQEGLAVLSEHLVGGLTKRRLRTLAARVVAVQALVDDADFVEAYRHLVDRGISRQSAFTVTVRVYRGGGLTKDAQYLSGLRDTLEYLRDGGAIETLFLGKLGFSHLATVRELRARGVARAPAIIPRYARDGAALDRLEQCRQRTVMELFHEAPA